MQPLVLDVCRAAGFEPEVVEVRETGTLVVLVAAGLGVGIVPSSVRALRLDGIAYVPLSGTDVRVPLAMAHRPEPGAAVRRVAEIVRAACAT
jgi:DNA-binding transcriptional LysR family regulator